MTDGVVVDSCRQGSLDDIVTWMEPYVVSDCVVAIDAPLIVCNEKGRRPCESVISRCFGARHASTHSSNLTNPSFRTGGRAADLARRLDLDTDPGDLPRRSGRWAIEVYPHTALVAVFDLPVTLKYKAKGGRTVESRRAEFLSCISLLESLSAADPPLDLTECTPWLTLRHQVASATTGAALDRVEDEIDAYICAYTGMLFWTHGTSRSRVVGDIATGYIVTPVTEELGALLDAAGGG